jgi:hypothetical protein
MPFYDANGQPSAIYFMVGGVLATAYVIWAWRTGNVLMGRTRVRADEPRAYWMAMAIYGALSLGMWFQAIRTL